MDCAAPKLHEDAARQGLSKGFVIGLAYINCAKAFRTRFEIWCISCRNRWNICGSSLNICDYGSPLILAHNGSAIQHNLHKVLVCIIYIFDVRRDGWRGTARPFQGTNFRSIFHQRLLANRDRRLESLSPLLVVDD